MGYKAEPPSSPDETDDASGGGELDRSKAVDRRILPPDPYNPAKTAIPRRLEALKAVALVDATADAEHLTRTLLDRGAVLRQAAGDAAHIAIAVTNGVDFLVPWNFRHIANAIMRSRIGRVCRQTGYEPSAICTPNELMEANHADNAD